MMFLRHPAVGSLDRRFVGPALHPQQIVIVLLDHLRGHSPIQRPPRPCRSVALFPLKSERQPFDKLRANGHLNQPLFSSSTSENSASTTSSWLAGSSAA